MPEGCSGLNGWVVALVVAVGAGLWMQWQNEAMSDLRAENTAYSAALADAQRQVEIERSRSDVDGYLKEGGDEGLSDYMSGAAGKLWP